MADVLNPNKIKSVSHTAAYRMVTAAAVLIGAFIVATSLYGVVRFFSPIPFWDQWPGYIGMYSIIRDGHWSYLWAQHNEHRIVFSRLLFLADIEFFGGMNIFTVFANSALLTLTGLVIWREGKGDRIWRAAITAALLFLWTQHENMTWGFESQCIAVYMFGFMAFAQLSREDSRKRLALAFLFCTLSTITMGNGFAAFFVGAVQLFIERRPVKESVIMAVGGVLAAAVYFWGYTPYVLPPDPGALQIKYAQLKYFAIFMGNPFFFLPWSNLLITGLLGASLFFVAVAAVLYLFATRRVTPYRAFLIGCYGFVLVSAIAATHSRWMLGLASATSSRYTTPTLMGYVVLALLLFDMAKSTRWRTVAMLVPTAAILILSGAQAAVKYDNGQLFKWKLAVLAHKIGIEHRELDAMIAPNTEFFLGQADAANAYQIGPWAKGWLHDAGIVQFDPSRVDPTVCRGSFDTLSRDSVAWQASGWVEPLRYANGDVLVLLTQANQTVGYAVSGQERKDVAEVMPGAPKDTGWTGFSKAGSGIEAYAYVGGKFCRLEAPAAH